MLRLYRWLAAATLVGTAPAARAQLTLRDALREADRAAYANREAVASTDAQRAARLVPFKGIVPSVHVEAGYARTTDPIGAFITTMRQRGVTPAAFDPRRLNYPAAVSNYQGGIVAEVPLVNADAWAGRQAAVRAAASTAAAAEWTRLATRVDVIRAYYGAVLAAERVATLEAAGRAAHAHVAQAQSMVRNGLATKSDALLASVRASDVDAQLAEARGTSATARSQLATLLGRERGVGSAVTIPAELPTSARIREVIDADTTLGAGAARTDVEAASLGADAARADATRARVAMLPRVNAMARWDWSSAARPYAGTGSWTVGVQATWSLFGDAGELGDARTAAARAAAARARAEGAAAGARLNVEQARTALEVALARLTIAEQSVVQAAEAHRIVEKRYGGGLATVVELLDAQATETQTALSLTQARYAVITAAAEHRQAIGGDPAALTALDEPAALTSTTHR